jgi:UDP-N-acetylglucosamine--N-acetylmuramyl-(pentapeptide) pyrophosphoryl-undecaprenol N-acetylglucosamine transferase
VSGVPTRLDRPAAAVDGEGHATALRPPTGSRVLAAASAGGHFKQLISLVGRLEGANEVTWLTHDVGFSSELLAAAGRSAERIVTAPYAAPRDGVNLARNAAVAGRVLRERRFDLAISTGAGIAVATLPLARARGVRSCFVETATRADGPSLTGRILSRTPGIDLYTQNPGAGFTGRWRYGGSVHDGFQRGPDRDVDRLRRVVVSVGTIRPYGFRRLLDAALRVLEPDVEVLWQTGCTGLDGLPIDGHASIPSEELSSAIAEADLVIAHAGTGTALTAFELGRCPVLVPRRAAAGEHIDDHQVDTARTLASRGLAVHLEAEQLSADALLRAARRSVVRSATPPPFTL